MKHTILLLLAIISAININADELSLIPQPLELTQLDGTFKLDAKTRIVAKSNDSKAVANYLQSELSKSSDFALEITTEHNPAINAIVLKLEDGRSQKSSLGKEGYELTVSPTQITITAPTATGLFYGVQTLRQLLPPANYSKTKLATDWKVPAVDIRDRPRFAWRGMHLDVSRNFYDVDFVKKYIDLLASHKFNVFHWHLTDDHGWRIEIKKYPKLTSIGAWRPKIGFGFPASLSKHYNEKGEYGGFYTQDQIRDIVRYASERHITVVPEIDVPGHATAALVAYPEYSCTEKTPSIALRAGIFGNVYCPGKESTFTFLTDILNEVIELFPGEFVHIGADECPKGPWKKCPTCQKRIKDEELNNEHGLQSYFVKRLDTFLNKKGKRLIGWGEILEGGLAPNAAVMSWKGMGAGIHAANAGHDVVMTPQSHTYFDFKHSFDAGEFGRHAGPLSTEKVYAFEPIPAEIKADMRKHVLGGQANVWSEQLPNSDYVEYMVAPRLCALSETLWSAKQHRNWADFSRRLIQQFERFNVMNINYRYPLGLTITEDAPGIVTVNSAVPGAEIRFTTDGSEPSTKSNRYQQPIATTSPTIINARAYHPKGPSGTIFTYQSRRPEGTVTTTLPSRKKSDPPAFAYDGSTSSVFWTGYYPAAGDTLTLTFAKPVQPKLIKVITGKLNATDILEHGILELSSDGETFQKVADFVKGQAEFVCKGSVKAIRLTVTSPQRKWLVIREIIVK